MSPQKEPNYPQNAMQWIYKERKDFCIIALTGATGSGCSEFAEVMEKGLNLIGSDDVRTPDSLETSDSNDIERKKKEIFKRKYQICFNYYQNNAKPFEIIKYKNVLLLYVLKYLFENNKETFSIQFLIESFEKILLDKFKKSEDGDKDYEIAESELTHFDLESIINDKLIKLVKGLNGESKNVYNIFYNDIFVEFCNSFYKILKNKDYYLKNFFVHRLATVIRATGNPFNKIIKKEKEKEYTVEGYKNNDCINLLIDLINHIIKGFHSEYPKEPRLFVIDSIKNSLEAHFLNERYSAFYLFAIHSKKENQKNNVETKIESYGKSDLTVDKILSLGETEGKEGDFEKGNLFAPDIKRCVANSDIHILINNDEDDFNFKTPAEKWIKYFSLINHPGIITPNIDERCMQIAFTAKYNSGCISRQVGAVITDKYNSVKSIGWNDVGFGQIPCLLRNVDELIQDDSPEKIYSEFERGSIPYKDGKTFKKHLELKYSSLDRTKIQGLNHSFCFKTLENEFRNNINQVYTRSLHAEENAMMQIAKSGGNGLEGGTMYVTASPCVLCSKKSYQLGIERIVYIDPYPDIAIDQILKSGYKEIKIEEFEGAVGNAYFKLYKPFLSYKDELKIIIENNYDVQN